eukprot:CAMPEP_0206480300 /NCGR_PEP_ID=MMETSP0324_2-20121206/37189_1 /ASSEMBLY_ACC=CAM_ASM_000836 /TAXON_ID=2866 /ORGANISM="Crypthecodinium cohnii, Strain Seligo" /LENGTH=42 /DNA_ID= /DNA_START= /DNA_END= /DNA_ORIENTATION=
MQEERVLSMSLRTQPARCPAQQCRGAQKLARKKAMQLHGPMD